MRSYLFRVGWWIACVVIGASVLRAATILETGPLRAPVTVSRSGQFVIHGNQGQSSGAMQGAPGRFRPVGDGSVILLRPDLLSVTCERVRQSVSVRLGMVDRAGSKVHLHLRRRHAVEARLDIVPEPVSGGWMYQMELPDEIEWGRLVRALVEVTLLDLANRENNGTLCVMPPLWFAEGLDCLLVNELGRDLIPEAETLVNRSGRRRDPLAPVRVTLAGRDPEGFTALTLVTMDQLSDQDRFTLFRANAALLVSEWLQDDPGRRHALEFLRQLPQHLNWQTAFLRSSNGRFETLLDVEKWWAVATVSVLSRDPLQQWPRERVITELRWIMSETADVTAATNGPVVRRAVPLAEIVRSWEFTAQKDVLHRKASQIQHLAVHAPPDLVPLLADCFQTLDRYLTSRSNAGVDPIGRSDIEVRGRILAKSTSGKLDQLERQIAARP